MHQIAEEIDALFKRPAYRPSTERTAAENSKEKEDNSTTGAKPPKQKKKHGGGSKDKHKTLRIKLKGTTKLNLVRSKSPRDTSST